MVFHYVKRNPETAFIVGFGGLLMAASVELIVGNRNGANNIGNYVFVWLIVGIALRAIRVIKGT